MRALRATTVGFAFAVTVGAAGSLALQSTASHAAPTPSNGATTVVRGSENVTQATAASISSAAPAPRFANDDPNDDLVVAPPPPRASCEADLAAAGVIVQPASLPVHEVGKRHKFSCGAEQVVIYKGSPAKIRYEPWPVVTCTMALALARFDALAQEEAKRTFGKPIVRVRQLGTYACREMANYPGWVSEHSYANAIDIEAFILKNGSEISVLRHFEKTAIGDAPKRKQGQMLTTLARRLFDEDVFSTVLTPYFDALHRNHFHLDLSRYRSDGTRPERAD